jgi:HEAT repeat protein
LRSKLRRETNADIKRRIIDELRVEAGRASTSNQDKQSIVTVLLREMINPTNTEPVKIAAIHALVPLVTILLARLKQATDDVIKVQIIRVLGKVGGASTSDQVRQSIVTELIREMPISTTYVKVNAIYGALGDIPLDIATVPLLQQLRQDPENKGLIIKPLRKIGRASTSHQVKQSIGTALIHVMKTADRFSTAQEDAIHGLEEIPLKSATEPLLQQLTLNMSTPYTKRQEYFVQIIIRALGEIRDPKAVRSLVTMLEKHGSILVRRQAAIALGKIRGSEALTALKRRLSQETSVIVKWAISQALLPPPQYIPRLFP